MELEGIATLWKREVRGYFREKAQLFSAIFTAALWLVVFGLGIGAMKFGRVSPEYNRFIFPGIIGMAVLLASIRSGVSILRDRESGFLRAIMAAPLSHITIVSGKILGGGTVATIQGLSVLVLGFFVDIEIKPGIVLATLPVMFLLALGLVGMGMVIASFMAGFEGFNVVMSLLFLPMFFLSGALFPLEALPDWLESSAFINPLTYGVDALRRVILGTSEFALSWNLVVLAGFASLMLLMSAITFERELK